MLWGSNVVAARGLVQSMPPMALVLCRWTVALLILLPFGGASLWRQRQIVLRHWRFLFLLALLGIAGFNSVVFIAVRYTTAINGTLIQGFIPVTVVCLSWIVNRERIPLATALAMLVSILGLSVIVTHGDLHGILHLRLNPGDLAIAIGVWFWGLYIVLVNRHPVGLSGSDLLLVLILIGDLMIALVCATGLAGDLSFHVTAERAAGILYIAALPSALAYGLWHRGIAIFGPNASGQFQYLLPVFGSLFAVVFLGEAFEGFHIVGTLLIFAGVYCATATLRRSRA
jgi:drug/metabolite transporter (DMT)-like permease